MCEPVCACKVIARIETCRSDGENPGTVWQLNWAPLRKQGSRKESRRRVENTNRTGTQVRGTSWGLLQSWQMYQVSRRLQRIDFSSDSPGFQSLVCHVPAVQCEAMSLNSLDLNFLRGCSKLTDTCPDLWSSCRAVLSLFVGFTEDSFSALTQPRVKGSQLLMRRLHSSP